MKDYVEIYVNKKVYTYLVPEELSGSVAIGSKVEVSLRNRSLEGYVLRFAEKPDFKTLPIKCLVDDIRYFDSDHVQLIDWISDYYKCFPETALKLIVPR